MDEGQIKLLIQSEHNVMEGLKNFQRATVERIDCLFRQGRNRVLVADEVGLGKTLIARGCIAKTGVLRAEEGDDLFKVVYVCSNQNIARKNIVKLDVYNTGGLDRLSDSRLSMQHLRIVEQEIECKNSGRVTQLIPLTPQTSFVMTYGGGTFSERALMFEILRRLSPFKNNQKAEESLNRFLAYCASRDWAAECIKYKRRVTAAEKATACSDNPYPQTIISEIEANYSDLIQELVSFLENDGEKDFRLLNKLRTMFARISVKRLQPDLVIMDEFQRFRFLLSNDISEMGIVAHEFLSQRDTRVLLLSATPYKLYNTLEEMEENPQENHYQEFMQVMEFLLKDSQDYKRFESVWNDYSEALRFLRQKGFDVVNASKEEAQKELYSAMCRTERQSVMDNEDFIDSSSAEHPLEITKDDILSYIEGCNFLEGIQGRNKRMPMYYAKSCPFLLSFMSNYKLMDNLKKYFQEHPERLSARKGLLWLNTDRINNYKPLLPANARLELLKEHLFKGKNKSHLFLWIPPSLPYYNLSGVYEGSQHFSKILIFSSWELVPKMIGSLISYESELLTIGRLVKDAQKKDRKNTHYFADNKRRYPYGRLVGGSEWYLLYPSPWLASLYNPLAYFNEKKSLPEICLDVRSKINSQLNQMRHLVVKDQGQADNRWYLVAPMIMDGPVYVKSWLEDFDKVEGKLRVAEMLSDFKKAIENNQELDFSGLNLGRQPDDLAEVLTQMAIGSPVNCIYRTNGNHVPRAVELAQVFLKRFNTTEATAVIACAFNHKIDDAHWIDLLRYCVDGCFQAMLDEYHHMLGEEVQFLRESDRLEAIHKKMCPSKESKEDRDSGTLTLRVRNYGFETPETIREKISGKGSGARELTMRSHFAVGFTQTKGDWDKGTVSKEGIQDAFNSPLRPFVLASTSIGQEGLDFHYYCRKIMHWNLPGNPIDLEQREGRVNRFKCLAIRQSLAQYYTQAGTQFDRDIWDEIFSRAQQDLLKPGESELTPFWCLGANQSTKIERIVPMYPLSRDQERYRRLIKILSLYRMTLGQARQEELIQYLLDSDCDKAQLQSLFMNLSPFDHKTQEDIDKDSHIWETDF